MKSLALRLLPALALVCGASSCVNVPKASSEDDARAKTFATRPGMCGLYVYRNESIGSTVELELELDGLEFGSTGSRNYLFTWLRPGKHTLAPHTDPDAELVIDAKAGTLVYVWQETRLGYWSADSKLEIVSEAVGQQGVRECALVLSTP